MTNGRSDQVTRPQAFLVDVYETILTCDHQAISDELRAIAGVTARAWDACLDTLGPALNVGRLSLAQAFEQVLRAGEVSPRPGLVAELVRRDRELLLASAHLHDDAVAFLEMLRSRGIMIALVSNCSEHTRQLLASLGVTALADSVVLSCEVGWAKPAARIYQHALDQLGVTAGAAVFVDDQPAYCAGAVALGMSAMQIVRDGPRPSTPPAGTIIINSLLQAEALI